MGAGRLAFCEDNSLSRAWFADNSMAGITPPDPGSLVGCKPPEGHRAAGPVADSGIATRSPAAAMAVVLDRDGMADAWERSHGLNPADGADGGLDADGDGDGDGDGWTNL